MESKEYKYGKDGKKPGQYPSELKEQAIAMFERNLPDFPSKTQCAKHVAELLGITAYETVFKWAKQAEIDGGQQLGTTTDEHEELRRLRRENAELKRANGILKAASAFFAAELDRPQNKQFHLQSCFRNYREDTGLMWHVEPICEVLTNHYGVKISSSGFYAFKNRSTSLRSQRDKHLKVLIDKIWKENYCCWGAKKVWRSLLNKGEPVASCTVERLMKEMGLRGLVRGKVKKTTIAGDSAKRPEALVKRSFSAREPNKLWVADFTYISTWEGWCYTAFVTDVFARRIIGWAVSSRMNEALITAAFRKAAWTRHHEGNDNLSGLIHHNDCGSQYTADGFYELLALHGIRASIGSVGDSYDNALAETMFGDYKCTLIYNPTKRPWKSKEQLEEETARWVHWHNNSNITEFNNWKTPMEIEEMLYTTGEDGRKCAQDRKA